MGTSDTGVGVGNQPAADLESTAVLIGLVRAGDEAASERLWSRHLPALRRWAHGRMPVQARHLADTDDLVQMTLVRTLKKVKEFEPRRHGAFFAYLRQALRNQILDHLRSAKRRPEGPLLVEPETVQPSPLETAVGTEVLEAYEESLEQLEETKREAIIMRVELGSSYQEVAEVIGSPTANAARMVVSRGLVQLAGLMNVH